MRFEDRITAIAEFGFTERQARFLDLVMLFAGLCVPRQYATFAGTAYGHTVSRFFDKLVQRGYATVCDCLHNRAEVYHVRHPRLYRAIDQPHSRYRRPVPARQVTDRLMRLDAIVLQPELRWLATEDEKVAFFSLMAPSLARERLPHVMVGQGGGALRLFPDDQPIGVASTGRVVFSYLVTAYETEGLRAFVQRQADLLRVLPGWTLRLVLPQQIADGATRFEGVVRDELAPLRSQLLTELKWYFAKRRGTPNPRAVLRGSGVLGTAGRLLVAAISAALPALVERRGRRLRDTRIAGNPPSPGTWNRADRVAGPDDLLSPSRTPGKPVPFVSKGGRGRGDIVRTVSTPAIDIAFGIFRVPRLLTTHLSESENGPFPQRFARGCPA